MKNGDMPANPLPNDATGRPYTFMDNEPPRGNHAVGLTKREYAAIKAMQGICSAYDPVADIANADYAITAKHAVEHADALLTELAKERGDV